MLMQIKFQFRTTEKTWRNLFLFINEDIVNDLLSDDDSYEKNDVLIFLLKKEKRHSTPKKMSIQLNHLKKHKKIKWTVYNENNMTHKCIKWMACDWFILEIETLYWMSTSRLLKPQTKLSPKISKTHYLMI